MIVTVQKECILDRNSRKQTNTEQKVAMILLALYTLQVIVCICLQKKKQNVT